MFSLSGAALILLNESRFLTLLQQAGITARLVLLILLVASLFSWAILYQKLRTFAIIREHSAKFLQGFRSSARLPDPKGLTTGASGSPLAAIYAAGFHELMGQVSSGGGEPRRVKSMNAIHVVMQLVAAEEIHKMEKWMSWLATIGSVTPFIGLFGTVVGVMDAFMGLGTAGAASLRAVAPGIAEALITTAAGLFAAIPAVIGYNHFLHQIKDAATRMHNFAAEFSAQVEKQFSA